MLEPCNNAVFFSQLHPRKRDGEVSAKRKVRGFPVVIESSPTLLSHFDDFFNASGVVR